MNRALLLEQLYYTDRCLAAVVENIRKQREVIERLETDGRGDSNAAVTARALLANMERSQALHVADRDRIQRLLAT